jgi:[ribosomal protein S5]-alanine N-acetyltransferase
MTAALPSVILNTARLRLRAHREDDLAELVTLAGVWEVASWLTKLPHPYTDDHGRGWIAHVRQAYAAGDPRTFAIALKDTDRLIGGVGLDGSSGDESGEPSLGYWLGPPHWARGYAREAVCAVIDYGFCKLRLESIRAVTDPDNVASQKVLLACGLSKIADINLAEPMRRGARRAPLFRITRHDHPSPWAV